MSTATTEALRCSVWARRSGLDPVGTAGSYAGFLLIEMPLPWPADIGEMPEVAALADLLAGRRLRVQAVVPPASQAGRRVVLYRAEGETYSTYHRAEATVDTDVTTAVAGLLERPVAAHPERVIDLLVCTHGRRDVCCGSAGTELAVAVAGDRLIASEVAVWRTSHTGGHRFAPTFLVLPEGTLWAFADAELIRRVLSRQVPFTDVAEHYRGCSGLGDPRVQALERAVLCRVGWELLDTPRKGGAVSDDGPEVRLSWAGPAGIETWAAEVTPGRTLPVPDCMKPIADARKSETEWRVSGLHRL